jgi:hypothetical protein
MHRKWEAQSIIIPIIHGTSLHGLIMDGFNSYEPQTASHDWQVLVMNIVCAT